MLFECPYMHVSSALVTRQYTVRTYWWQCWYCGAAATHLPPVTSSLCVAANCGPNECAHVAVCDGVCVCASSTLGGYVLLHLTVGFE